MAGKADHDAEVADAFEEVEGAVELAHVPEAVGGGAVLGDAEGFEFGCAFEHLGFVVEGGAGEDEEVEFAALFLVLEPVGFEAFAPTGLPGIDAGAFEFAEEGEDAGGGVVLGHGGGEDVIEVGVAVDGVGAGDEAGDGESAEFGGGEEWAGLGWGDVARRGFLLLGGGGVGGGEEGGEGSGAAEEVAAVGFQVVDGFDLDHSVHQGRFGIHGIGLYHV